MTKNKSYLVRLIAWVWQKPKGKVGAKLKQVCDDIPQRQRLTVVTVLLSVFVLAAFFVFGHACYKVGSRQALHEFEIRHIHHLDITETDTPAVADKKAEYNTPGFDNIMDSVYDIAGVESED